MLRPAGDGVGSGIGQIGGDEHARAVTRRRRTCSSPPTRATRVPGAARGGTEHGTRPLGFMPRAPRMHLLIPLLFALATLGHFALIVISLNVIFHRNLREWLWNVLVVFHGGLLIAVPWVLWRHAY